MRGLWASNESIGAYVPESFFAAVTKAMPYFSGYRQQDAHEFLRYLCDRLHYECVERHGASGNDTENANPGTEAPTTSRECLDSVSGEEETKSPAKSTNTAVH